jgi:hypothetical protein
MATIFFMLLAVLLVAVVAIAFTRRGGDGSGDGSGDGDDRVQRGFDVLPPVDAGKCPRCGTVKVGSYCARCGEKFGA